MAVFYSRMQADKEVGRSVIFNEKLFGKLSEETQRYKCSYRITSRNRVSRTDTLRSRSVESAIRDQDKFYSTHTSIKGTCFIIHTFY